jgi:hypothetical protein
MAIIVNGETVPVTIAEMEVYFNTNSDRALNDLGLLKIYDITNDVGKQNWLVLSKKYNRPMQLAAARMGSTIIKYAALGLGAYFLIKLLNKK